jgi:hypothetical protein
MIRSQVFRVLFVLLVVAAAGCTDPYQEAQPGLQRGDEVVAALEAYQKEHGRYPTSLPELQPQYISEIPALQNNPHAHFRFYYNRSVSGYKLGFFGANLHCVKDQTSERGWTCSKPL